jgi:hypothetical protein
MASLALLGRDVGTVTHSGLRPVVLGDGYHTFWIVKDGDSTRVEASIPEIVVTWRPLIAESLQGGFLCC